MGGWYRASLKHHAVEVHCLEEAETHEGVNFPKGAHAVRDIAGNTFYFLNETALRAYIKGGTEKHHKALEEADTYLKKHDTIELEGVKFPISVPTTALSRVKAEIKGLGGDEALFIEWEKRHREHMRLKLVAGGLLSKGKGQGNSAQTAHLPEKMVNLIVDLASRYHSAAEIVKIVRQIHPGSTPLREDRVARIFSLYGDRITQGRAEFEESHSDIRLTHKKSRLEELSYLYGFRKDLFLGIVKDYETAKEVIKRANLLLDKQTARIEAITCKKELMKIASQGKRASQLEGKSEEALQKIILRTYQLQHDKKIKNAALGLKEAATHLDSSYKALGSTLEAIRKEEEGEVLNIKTATIKTMEGLVSAQIKREALKTLPLGLMVLAKVASSTKTNTAQLMAELADSCYSASLDGGIEVTDDHPSNHAYDWGIISNQREDDSGSVVEGIEPGVTGNPLLDDL